MYPCAPSSAAATAAAAAVCCEAPSVRSWTVSSLPIHSFDPSVTLSRKRRHATMAAPTTATATMAAAGFDKRASTSTASSSSSSASSSQTPGSGGFPSELRSPMTASPGFMKQRDSDLKTPITPPSAYLDFLKNMSPALMSPAPTSTSARFSFHEKSFDKSSEASTDKCSISPPTSQPALSRNTSYDSNSSAATSSTDRSAASSVSAASTARRRPESPRVTIPPSPFAKPAPKSARTPRLRIPQSPFSAGPQSAHSLASPYVSTPLSAQPWSASVERNVDTEANGQPGKVSVRQVVTRTVTYCRTPLETVPDGSLWKRRKIEHEDTKALPEAPQSPKIKEVKREADSEESAVPALAAASVKELTPSAAGSIATAT